MTILLDKAIRIATVAHQHQTDKGGEPYILHPLRVMLAMQTHEQRIVAVMHDVLEDDGGWTLKDIRSRFGASIADALDALTHRPNETYTAYVRRIATNPLAVTVKIADLTDNMQAHRLPQPLTRADHLRNAKYQQARDYLLLFNSYGVS